MTIVVKDQLKRPQGFDDIFLCPIPIKVVTAPMPDYAYKGDNN